MVVTGFSTTVRKTTLVDAGPARGTVFATPATHQRFVICDMDFHTFAGVASTRVVLRTVVEKPVTTMAYNGMLCLYVLAARCFYYIRL